MRKQRRCWWANTKKSSRNISTMCNIRVYDLDIRPNTWRLYELNINYILLLIYLKAEIKPHLVVILYAFSDSFFLLFRRRWLQCFFSLLVLTLAVGHLSPFAYAEIYCRKQLKYLSATTQLIWYFNLFVFCLVFLSFGWCVLINKTENFLMMSQPKKNVARERTRAYKTNIGRKQHITTYYKHADKFFGSSDFSVRYRREFASQTKNYLDSLLLLSFVPFSLFIWLEFFFGL